MGAPGPQTPSHNAYRVHFLSSPSVPCATALLEPLKVAVRVFPVADNDFFAATASILTAREIAGLEKNPERKGLLFVQANGSPDPAAGERMLWPDLWWVENPDQEGDETLAQAWIQAGAGAVAILGQRLTVWESRNAAFGNSRGKLPIAVAGNNSDAFASGAVLGIIEELLGEDLFDKTTTDVDRACLEMRPLRLGRAVESGLAAQRVFRGGLEFRPGEALGTLRRLLQEWRGPLPRSWGQSRPVPI